MGLEGSDDLACVRVPKLLRRICHCDVFAFSAVKCELAHTLLCIMYLYLT